jgi:hypothetical protein
MPTIGKIAEGTFSGGPAEATCGAKDCGLVFFVSLSALMFALLRHAGAFPKE